MAGRTVQVNGAGRRMGVDPSRSVSMLQDAITNYGQRADNKRDRSLAALDDLIGFEEDNVKRDILQNTNKNIFNQNVADVDSRKIGDKFNMEWAESFNPDNSARVSTDPLIQKRLEENQKLLKSGKYGVSRGEESPKILQDMNNEISGIGMIEDDAKGYSDRVYDNLLASGIKPDEAEKIRQQQLKRYQAPGTSKAELERMKAMSALNLQSNKFAVETALKQGKNYTQTSNSDAGYNKYKKSKADGSKGGYGAFTPAEASKLGLRVESENPYSFLEWYDKIVADDQGDINSKVGMLAASGFTKREQGIILSMPGSIINPGQDSARIDADAVMENTAKYEAMNGGTNSGNIGGGGSSNVLTQNTSYSPESLAAIDKINASTDAKEREIWGDLSKGGKKILFGSNKVDQVIDGPMFNEEEKKTILGDRNKGYFGTNEQIIEDVKKEEKQKIREEQKKQEVIETNIVIEEAKKDATDTQKINLDKLKEIQNKKYENMTVGEQALYNVVQEAEKVRNNPKSTMNQKDAAAIKEFVTAMGTSAYDILAEGGAALTNLGRSFQNRSRAGDDLLPMITPKEEGERFAKGRQGGLIGSLFNSSNDEPSNVLPNVAPNNASPVLQDFGGELPENAPISRERINANQRANDFRVLPNMTSNEQILKNNNRQINNVVDYGSQIINALQSGNEQDRERLIGEISANPELMYEVERQISEKVKSGQYPEYVGEQLMQELRLYIMERNPSA